MDLPVTNNNNFYMLGLICTMFKNSFCSKILGIREDQVHDLSKRINLETNNNELSLFVQLVLTLLWLKHSLTHVFLAWIAGVSKSTITRQLSTEFHQLL
jgi:hypothetical protein